MPFTYRAFYYLASELLDVEPPLTPRASEIAYEEMLARQEGRSLDRMGDDPYFLEADYQALCNIVCEQLPYITAADWSGYTWTKRIVCMRNALKKIKASKESPALTPFTDPGAAPVPDVPKTLLTGWNAILKALDENKDNLATIKRLNKKWEGPIANKGRGTRPTVYREDLIPWWNRLATRHQELANQQEGARLSTQAQYNYGREGAVVPEIGGEVKKRRSDRRT